MEQEETRNVKTGRGVKQGELSVADSVRIVQRVHY
jgi:hypothetical protein